MNPSEDLSAPTADHASDFQHDFDLEVLSPSEGRPVVVDFWAPWCAPCRTLGPILEQEVAALGGRVLLVKVDTDAHPELSTRFQIRGIPAVKVFRRGRVVDEFTGSQSAAFVRAFLAKLAPSPDEEALERAIDARKAGDGPGVEAIACEILARPPGVPSHITSGAALLLATTLYDRGETGELESVLARIDPRSSLVEQADTLRALAALCAEAAAYGGASAARAALAANEGDLEARYALAAAHVADGDIAAALPEFLEIVSRSRKFKGDAAHKALLLLFRHLGPDHELSREYRRRLQIVT